MRISREIPINEKCGSGLILGSEDSKKLVLKGVKLMSEKESEFTGKIGKGMSFGTKQTDIETLYFPKERVKNKVIVGKVGSGRKYRVAKS